MPDRRTHLSAGVLVGIGAGLYVSRKHEGWPLVARLLGALPGSIAGAALPDIVEPAVHSWHRRSFHSWWALAGTAGVALGPPVGVRQWIAAREGAAAGARTRRDLLPAGHPECAGLWLAEMLEHLLVGAASGLPAGYASHLVLDAASPRSLPPI